MHTLLVRLLLVALAAPLAHAQTAPYRVAPSRGAFQAREFMPIGLRLGFEANIGGGGGLWISDGTEAGTTALASGLDLQVAHNNEAEWGRIGDQTLFVAATASNGTELWRTDGTAAGTGIVREIVPGYDVVRDVFRSPSFGHGSGYPWAHQQVKAGDVLYFTASALESGRELWKTDGTAAGTVLVKDFAPGTADGFPNSVFPAFARVQNTRGSAPAVFVGPDRGLWATDGTDAGTVKLGSFVPTSTTGMVELGGKVYLAGKSSTSAPTVGIVVTDGTAAGTSMLSEGAFSFPGLLAASGDRFYFVANDVGATETALWVSDGTAAGTRRLALLHSGIRYGGQIEAAPGGRMFLSLTTSGTDNYRLWKSDGSAAGTALVKAFPGVIGPMVVAGTRAYFNHRPTFSTPLGTLYVSDGTEAGTVPVPTSTGGTFSANALRQVGPTFYLSLSTSLSDPALWAIGNLPSTARAPEPTASTAVIVQARGTGRVAVTAPAGALLRVEAFDVLGRRVSVLHDGPSSGAHTLALPEGLPAGVYLVRAVAGGLAASLPLVHGR